VGGPNTNPRWRPAAISKIRKNCAISKTAGLITMKFGTLMHIGLPDPVGHKKIRTLKSQDGGAAKLHVIDNCDADKR